MMRGRADVHVHTKYSGMTRVEFIKVPDSVSEPRDVVRAAEHKGLDVLCVTDHNSLRGALKAKQIASKVEVVLGEEIVTQGGEVLGLFLQEAIPPGLTAQETVERIHAQGGVAVAPHPFSSRCRSLGTAVSQLDLDGIEVLNSMHIDGYSNAFAKHAFSVTDIARVGGSDAHHHAMVGNAYTVFEGTTAEELREAIVKGATDFGGSQTSLRQIVWMIAELTAQVECALGRSLLGMPDEDDAEWVKTVRGMKLSSRMMSLVGATMFLAPPCQLIAGVVGVAVHESRSRSELAPTAGRTSALARTPGK